MTEILNRSQISCIQLFIDELVHQSSEIGMQVNTKKTKEMFNRSTLKDPPMSVTLSGETAERVATFKLLGIHVSNDLKWAHHIQTISPKGVHQDCTSWSNEMCWSWNWWLAVLLFSDTSSSGVRLPSLTFQLDCCTVTGTGMTSEKGHEYYISWYALWVIIDHRHTGGATGSTDLAIFQKSLNAGVLMSSLLTFR